MASVESRPSRAVVTARSSTHGTRSRAVKQVQQSCSLRQLCIEMANLPRSSQFRSASSLSCTRCWPWQGTVLKVISALGLELHVTAARCQLRRRARRWLSNQPPTRVDRPPYTLCYAIPVRRRAGVGLVSTGQDDFALFQFPQLQREGLESWAVP